MPALEITAPDTYRTLKAPSTSLYKVKGSKHFGYAFPVYDEDEVKERLEEVKKEHHQARHHCYAYRLGLDKKLYRANDDGEPSSTAGKPILGQIRSFDLTNILIVVVRYFGGTKLGVGGLIDAYKTAAKAAIESGTIIEQTVMNHYKIHFGYDQMSAVMAYLGQENLPQSNQDFRQKCSLQTSVRLEEADRIIEGFEKIEGVSTTFLKRG
ncbi:IMPACT family protein [Halocola ammonii]